MRVNDTVTFHNIAAMGHDPAQATVLAITREGRLDIRTTDGIRAENVPVLDRSLNPVSGFYCHELAPAPQTQAERIAALEFQVERLLQVVRQLDPGADL